MESFKKALSFSELSGINVDTADHAMTEMANRGDSWTELIKNAMAGYQIAEGSRKITLSNDLELTCRQEDDGIYSGEVRNMNSGSGEYGEVLHKIIKKTLNDLIQELKLKQFIVPMAAPKVAQAEAIEAIVEDHEETWKERENDPMEAVADLAMVEDIKAILQSHTPKPEPLTANNAADIRERSPEAMDLLNTILNHADMDSRDLNIHIHLAKAKPANVGDVHTFKDGKSYQKQPDGTWKPYKSPRTKGIEATKEGKLPKEAKKQENPYTVELEIEVAGKIISKKYEGLKGESKKWIELDVIDKLHRAFAGKEFKIKDVKASREDMEKSLGEEPESESLEKGGKRAEIGEIRTWGKHQFQKQADGWYYVDGPNKGKKMGGTKSTPKEPANKIQDTKETNKETKAPTKQSKEKKPKSPVAAASPKSPYALSDKAAPTAFLMDNLKFNETGKTISVRKLATGKPSKALYKSPKGVDTNLVGTVSFGKADIASQEQLNNLLADSEIILNDIGIRFKQPIDFTCQNIKNPKKQQATFYPLKSRFEANDRIDIADRSGGAGKSLLHEIGHAIDYSLTGLDQTDTSFMSESQFKDNPNNSDFNRLKGLLEDSPFYKERSDKDYLSNPTEIFARAFEVYTFNRAKKLQSEGKITSTILDGFNPDFLKGGKEAAGIKSIHTGKALVAAMESHKVITDSFPQFKANVEEYEKIKDSMQVNRDKLGKMTEAKPGAEFSDSEREVFFGIRAENSKYMERLKKLDRAITKDFKLNSRALNTQVAGFREDADKVESEIVEIMGRILKNNEIKKAMKNLTFKPAIPDLLESIIAALLTKSIQNDIIKSNS